MTDLTTPTGRGRRWTSVRGALDTLATVLVIAVAVVMLYRTYRVPVVPVRAAAGNGPAARPPAPLPTEPVSLNAAAIKGDPAAKVVVLGYSDFQCPYCRVFAQDTWPALQTRFIDTGKIRFAFRHLPLDNLHPQARRIAEAAECANRQGRFWEFHDYLFARQKELSQANLLEYGKAVGVTSGPFTACLAGQATDVVKADSAGAELLGVSGTPAFFVGRVEPDGRLRITERLMGAQPVEAFAKAIDQALAGKS